MKPQRLFNDDDAVSPVIGVILMVAITVILAAVIGAFVLGFGTGSEAAPQVSWDVDESDNSTTFTHRGGDSVNTEIDTLSASLEGNTVEYDGNDDITGGDQLDVTNDTAGDFTDGGDGVGDGATDWVNGNTVRLVWSPSGSDDTNVIGEYQLSDQ